MPQNVHLLVVDDDREIRDLLSALLSRKGYRVTTARDANEVHRVLSNNRVDLVILDLMLPGKDGLTICSELRTSGPTPVIMLTARGDAVDRVVGLELGADDYLTKPFDVRELEARIKAVLRRTSGKPETTTAARQTRLRFDGWLIDLRRRQLQSPDGTLIELTSGEFDLLTVFAERPQRVLNRDQLIDLTRGRNANPFDRSVDIQISRLRYKIETDPKHPVLLKTIRNGGYVFTPAVERE